jgi:hypothetical protein
MAVPLRIMSLSTPVQVPIQRPATSVGGGNGRGGSAESAREAPVMPKPAQTLAGRSAA